MMGRSLQAEILARLSESPDGRCICFYGARETVHWQTRSQLYSKSVAVAQQLRQEGVRPGDICIIVLPSGETSQTTTYLYGVTPLQGSTLDDNDLLYEVQYPDPTTGESGQQVHSQIFQKPQNRQDEIVRPVYFCHLPD